jgi:hypothetical protein
VHRKEVYEAIRAQEAQQPGSQAQEGELPKPPPGPDELRPQA